MSIDVKQLKSLVIVPTLVELGLYSDSAVNLLLGTCAQESKMGTYLKQINGIALGIYQIESKTHDDVWENYLNYNTILRDKISRFSECKANNLITNLAYSTAIARIIYLRVPERLPNAYDVAGLARYWKQYYNTEQGKGCVADFIANYKRYVENV
jgi:hypothetical protein